MVEADAARRLKTEIHEIGTDRKDIEEIEEIENSMMNTKL
jgi:hypothetical protein